MVNSQRYRFPKTVLFGITGLYIILIVATYFLYYIEPYINCVKRILVAQVMALLFQVVLNYVNYHSKNKIFILTTLFISAMIVSGVLSTFFNLELMCKYFGI